MIYPIFKMKVALAIILSFCCVSEISGFTISKIIDKPIRFVNFDIEGNTYVVALHPPNVLQLYRLNPSNELSLITNVTNWIHKAFVSSHGDSYLVFRDPDQPLYAIGIVRSNSTEVKVVDKVKFLSLFHLDNNDNFFYENDKTIYLIRPNSYLPVALKNLEVGGVISYPATDKLGNTYVGIHKISAEGNEKLFDLALITNEALQEDIPQGAFVNLSGITTTDRVENWGLDKENNLWFKVNVKVPYENSIKKLVNGTLKTVLTSNSQQYNYITHSKGKTYFSVGDLNRTASSIIYVTSNDEIVEIPYLKNLETSYNCNRGRADSEGWIYFYSVCSNFSSSLGSMVLIKPDETEAIPISIESKQHYHAVSKSVAVDFNDDLWLFELDIHHLKKGETVPILRSDSKEVSCGEPRVYFNFVAKRIYVTCDDEGLFTVENV